MPSPVMPGGQVPQVKYQSWWLHATPGQQGLGLHGVLARQPGRREQRAGPSGGPGRQEWQREV